MPTWLWAGLPGVACAGPGFALPSGVGVEGGGAEFLEQAPEHGPRSPMAFTSHSVRLLGNKLEGGMGMDSASLSMLASRRLVKAASTSGWNTIRTRATLLFGRGSPDIETEGALDQTRRELEFAIATGLDVYRTERRLARQWERRLADLLDIHPDAEAELQELLNELSKPLPPPGSPADPPSTR